MLFSAPSKNPLGMEANTAFQLTFRRSLKALDQPYFAGQLYMLHTLEWCFPCIHGSLSCCDWLKQHDSSCISSGGTHSQPASLLLPWQMAVIIANGAQELNIFTLTAASPEPIATAPLLHFTTVLLPAWCHQFMLLPPLCFWWHSCE